MYVMSALPREQQSVAGGIFQTITRLCLTIGFGLTTALFDAVQQSPPTTGYHANDPIAPYSAVFWFATAASGFSFVFLPFLKIGTQGAKEQPKESPGEDESPREKIG